MEMKNFQSKNLREKIEEELFSIKRELFNIWLNLEKLSENEIKLYTQQLLRKLHELSNLEEGKNIIDLLFTLDSSKILSEIFKRADKIEDLLHFICDAKVPSVDEFINFLPIEYLSVELLFNLLKNGQINILTFISKAIRMGEKEYLRAYEKLLEFAFKNFPTNSEKWKEIMEFIPSDLLEKLPKEMIDLILQMSILSILNGNERIVLPNALPHNLPSHLLNRFLNLLINQLKYERERGKRITLPLACLDFILSLKSRSEKARKLLQLFPYFLEDIYSFYTALLFLNDLKNDEENKYLLEALKKYFPEINFEVPILLNEIEDLVNIVGSRNPEYFEKHKVYINKYFGRIYLENVLNNCKWQIILTIIQDLKNRGIDPKESPIAKEILDKISVINDLEIILRDGKGILKNGEETIYEFSREYTVILLKKIKEYIAPFHDVRRIEMEIFEKFLYEEDFTGNNEEYGDLIDMIREKLRPQSPSHLSYTCLGSIGEDEGINVHRIFFEIENGNGRNLRSIYFICKGNNIQPTSDFERYLNVEKFALFSLNISKENGKYRIEEVRKVNKYEIKRVIEEIGNQLKVPSISPKEIVQKISY